MSPCLTTQEQQKISLDASDKLASHPPFQLEDLSGKILFTPKTSSKNSTSTASYTTTHVLEKTAPPVRRTTLANQPDLHLPGTLNTSPPPNQHQASSNPPSCSMRPTPATTSAQRTLKSSPEARGGMREEYGKAFTFAPTLLLSTATRVDTLSLTALTLS